MRHGILHVWKELNFGMLLLKGQDDQTWKNHNKIACCVIFLMWMAKLTHLWLLSLSTYNVCCVSNL
jgi:hypothetical protein